MTFDSASFNKEIEMRYPRDVKEKIIHYSIEELSDFATTYFNSGFHCASRDVLKFLYTKAQQYHDGYAKQCIAQMLKEAIEKFEVKL